MTITLTERERIVFTALVTAARELIAAFDANANAPVTDEYWIALYAKKRALTAALEAFPND